MIFPAVLFSAAAMFATSCFYKLYRDKVGLGAPLFWAIAFAPQSAVGFGYFIWVVCMRFMGYGFIGIGGVVGFYDVPVTAAAYLLFGEIFTVVQRAAEKKESSNLKKIFAIILLIIIGVVALLVMVIAGMLLGHVADYKNSGLGLVIRIAVALAGTFGVDRLRILYKKKYGLKAPLFCLCAYAPIAIWAVCSIATFIFFGYSYSGYSYLVAETVIVLAGALLWLAVSADVKRAKGSGGSLNS